MGTVWYNTACRNTQHRGCAGRVILDKGESHGVSNSSLKNHNLAQLIS